jgi:YbgC/YbaW family acyl-CoA thioester hydrolase
MPHCTVHRRVEFAETDMAGIVHFSHFFRWMESAEHAFFRQCGLSIHTRLGEETYGWPRVACAFTYQAPLRFEDEVAVELDLMRVGESSLTFRCRVCRAGTVVAEGTSTSVCVAMVGGAVEGTKRRIPEAVRVRLPPPAGN